MAINTQKLVIIGINYTVHMFICGTNISGNSLGYQRRTFIYVSISIKAMITIKQFSALCTWVYLDNTCGQSLIYAKLGMKTNTLLID